MTRHGAWTLSLIPESRVLNLAICLVKNQCVFIFNMCGVLVGSWQENFVVTSQGLLALCFEAHN